MLAIYILLQQTLICLFCSLFCSCSLWFCLFVSAACSSACWWQRGYRLMMVVALICLAEKYRANRMQHCRPEIGSSVDMMGSTTLIGLLGLGRTSEPRYIDPVSVCTGPDMTRDHLYGNWIYHTCWNRNS